MSVFTDKMTPTVKTIFARLINGAKDYRKPIDIREICNSPVAGCYYGFTQPVVIEAALNKGRGRPLFTMGIKGNHPFIKAAKNYLETGKEESIREVLEHFYRTVKPQSAASLLNTPEPVEALREFAPWGLVMPWDDMAPAEQEKKVAQSVKKENEREQSTIGIEKGWAWTGPAHSEKITIESRRLKKVIDSIKADGYYRNNDKGGDIPVTVLKNGKDWVWQAKTGQHRAIALSALGYDTLPIRMIKMVRIEDVDYWPNVVNKLFNKDEAVLIFFQIYKSNIPNNK